MKSILSKIWQRILNLPISVYITLGNSVVLVAGFVVMLIVSFNVYFNDKIRDVKTIHYLQLENYSEQLLRPWLSRQIRKSTPLVRNVKDSRYQSCVPKASKKKYYFSICYDENVVFVKKSTGYQVFAAPLSWPMPDKQNESKVFILSRSGDLVFGRNVKELQLLPSEFVQRYIKNSLSHGQIELESDAGLFIGYFSEIADTNTVFFQETLNSDIQASVLKTSTDLATKMLWITVVAFILLAIFNYIQFDPFKKLIAITSSLGRGDFSVRIFPSGVGEVRKLSTAISRLTSQLRERDRSISEMHESNLKSIRLESEFNIARNIQENLIVGSDVVSADFEKASRYIPASEVGGDWFSFHYCEKRSEMLIVIVDISGHGAASAIFTAIVAGLFSEIVVSGPEEDSLSARASLFLSRINAQILFFGKGGWHATAQIFVVNAENRTIDLLNAGHTIPIILRKDLEEMRSLTRMKIGSSVLGLTNEISISHSRYDFPLDSLLVMYSDGLTERLHEKTGRQIGRRKILKIAEKHSARNAEDIAMAIVTQWKEFGGNLEADDDLCLICLKAV